MSLAFLFDAVIFDLDGTLVATNRFWVAAARSGAKKALAELGLPRELPLAAEWMSMVGLPMKVGFAQIFPDLSEEQRDFVMQGCIVEEKRALKAGGAALMPDALEVIERLANSGVRLAIASNCGQFYLDSMLDSFSLRKWIEAPRCLDTPGIHTKSDMIADVLDRFETRSAVMIGDRSSDRDAAWENGIPHVHLTSGYASEEVHCEASIDGLAEFLPLLDGRRSWIEQCRQSMGDNVRSIGVTGGPCSGKSLFARDLARLLPEPTPIVELEWFRREAPPWRSSEEVLAHVALRYDLDLLEEQVFEPAACGAELRLEPGGGRKPLVIAPGQKWILEGPFLLHPRIASRLDRVAALEVPDEMALRRCAGRDSRQLGPRTLLALRSEGLPLQAAFESGFPARERADWFAAADPFGQPLPVPRPVE